MSNPVHTSSKCSLVTRTNASAALGRSLPAIAFLAPDYSESQKRFFEFVGLHGRSGNHTNSASLTNLIRYAAQCDMLIVTPTSENSWDNDPETRAEASFAECVIQEPIALAACTFRAHSTPHLHTVPGLSKGGGYDAMLTATLHPEFFATTSSICKAIDDSSGIGDVSPDGRESTNETEAVSFTLRSGTGSVAMIDGIPHLRNAGVSVEATDVR